MNKLRKWEKQKVQEINHKASNDLQIMILSTVNSSTKLQALNYNHIFLQISVFSVSVSSPLMNNLRKWEKQKVQEINHKASNDLQIMILSTVNNSTKLQALNYNHIFL